MRAVYLQANWLLRYALIVTHRALCLVQNLLPNPVKVIEALACMDTESQQTTFTRGGHALQVPPCRPSESVLQRSEIRKWGLQQNSSRYMTMTATNPWQGPWVTLVQK